MSEPASRRDLAPGPPDDAPDAPVALPELPATLVVSSPQQLKACADPVRSRILGILQHRPATASQIAAILGDAPNRASYHLRVLEAAGLVQIVARRVVRGIVAKYYARTARTFLFEVPDDVAGATGADIDLLLLAEARDELARTQARLGPDGVLNVAIPRARLTPADAARFAERLEALVRDFFGSPPDPAGRVYCLTTAFFAVADPDGPRDDRPSGPDAAAPRSPAPHPTA
jgi:DNA-binding transcriptional ArsR family regulator